MNHAAIPDGEVDEIRQWVDAVSVWISDHEISDPFFFRAHKHLKTLLARLTALEAEIATKDAALGCLGRQYKDRFDQVHELRADNAALKAEVAGLRRANSSDVSVPCVTDEMLLAAEQYCGIDDSGRFIPLRALPDVFRAMLSASPQAKGEGDGS